MLGRKPQQRKSPCDQNFYCRYQIPTKLDKTQSRQSMAGLKKESTRFWSNYEYISKDRSFSIRTDLAHERTATLLRLYNREILYVSYMLYVIGRLSVQSKTHKAQRLINYYWKYMQQKKNINRFFSCFFVCFSISRLSIYQSKTHKAQRLIIIRNTDYQK